MRVVKGLILWGEGQGPVRNKCVLLSASSSHEGRQWSVNWSAECNQWGSGCNGVE